ncbi:hypothetical protein [Methylomagnum sp.]
MQEIPNKPHRQPASSWLLGRLTEKSTWSGAGLVVVCALILMGMPIIKLVAWIGLIYGLYAMFSAE